MTGTRSENVNDDAVIGFVAKTSSSVAPHFCTDCGEDVSRDVEKLTQSDMKNFEKASCTLCGATFYDDGEAQPIIDSTVNAVATSHEIRDDDTTVKTGDVEITTSITIECTCDRHITITNAEEETCECGREWSVQHGDRELLTKKQ